MTTSCSCSTSATSTTRSRSRAGSQPWFGIVKVGYELYAAAGPTAFDALHDTGFRVFADLKLHDIPNTVERGARGARPTRRRVPELPRRRWRRRCCAPASRVSHEGAARRGTSQSPIALAVTVLTSEPNADALARTPRRSRATRGATASCARARHRRSRARCGLRTMVPGIRLAGGDAHDQARVATPGDAIAPAPTGS